MEKIYALLEKWKNEIFNEYNSKDFYGKIIKNHKYYYSTPEIRYTFSEKESRYISNVDETNKKALRLPDRNMNTLLKMEDYIQKNGYDKEKSSLAKNQQKINKKLFFSPQAKAGELACEILNDFLTAEENFKKGLYEQGILILLDSSNKRDKYKKALANANKLVKAGTGKKGKNKLTPKKEKEMYSFMQSLLDSGIEYTRADDKDPNRSLEKKSVVYQTSKKFGVSSRQVQKLYPKKTFN